MSATWSHDREALMKSGLAMVSLAVGCAISVSAQQVPRPPQSPSPTTGLSNGPIFLDADGQKIKVTVIKGLQTPWALAVMPDLNILVTERAGRLRIIRNGVLDYKPVV